MFHKLEQEVNIGNGYEIQTFTTDPNVTWKVFNIKDDSIELISKDMIKKNEDSKEKFFCINSAIGYLYVNQELNEICKIYGYGYGADTSIETEYALGGPLDNLPNGKIIGSGARSLSDDDVNKKAKVGEVVDGKNVTKSFKELNSEYGNTTNPTVGVKYPTIFNETGISTTTALKNSKNTDYYRYSLDLIKDENDRKTLYYANDIYWLSSSYCMRTEENRIVFGIRKIAGNINMLAPSFNGYVQATDKYLASAYCRPIVTIKKDFINYSNPKENTGVYSTTGWILK